MATEQYFQEVSSDYELNRDESSLKSWKSSFPPIDESETINSSGFDCNICLDCVQDPVITMCGHLYCWPCIYKWIHYQTTSSDDSDDHRQQPQCPVCKLDVSEKTIIPLYGPGLTPKPSDEKVQNHGIVIPQRPPTPRPTELHHHHRSNPQPYPNTNRAAPVLSTLGGTRTRIGTGTETGTGLINFSHPTVGMFGEMVHGRIFGNSETTVYTYPNSYYNNIPSSASPRVRRHIVEVDKSLSRLCFFLFCCMILCLVLF